MLTQVYSVTMLLSVHRILEAKPTAELEPITDSHTQNDEVECMHRPTTFAPLTEEVSTQQ